MANRITTDLVRGVTVQDLSSDPASRQPFGEEMPDEGAR